MIKQKKTIVIFGISSFVGSNLAEFLKKDFRIIGTYNDNPVSIPGVLCIPVDILNRDAIQLVLFNFRPEVTIYCVGLTSINDCHEYEGLADSLNTTGLFNIASFSERYKSKLVYISSSYVFSGEKVTYLEDDTPLSNTIYGKTKGAAEFFIQKTCLNYIIFRTCELYGRSLNPKQTTWFEYIQEKLSKGEDIKCDTKVKIGFLDVVYLSMLIKMSIEENVTNRLFQVSSKDIMSRYEFAKAYTEVFEDGADLISKGQWPFPCLSSSIIQSDLSQGLEYQIDTENIESGLNVELPDIKESLELTKFKFGGNSAKKFSLKKGGDIIFI